MGTRRRLREQRERERKLTIRHRWYAGGLATLLSGALIFTGVSPAVAEDGQSGNPDLSVEVLEEKSPGVSETPGDPEKAPEDAEKTPEDLEKTPEDPETPVVGDSFVSPMMLIDPTPETAVVRVNKAVLRATTGTYPSTPPASTDYAQTHLEGARFELRATLDGPRLFDEAWCEIDSDESACDIAVAAPYLGTQPWVVEIEPAPDSPAAETFPVEIATGGATTVLTNQGYPARTSALTAGATFNVPRATVSGSNQALGTGAAGGNNTNTNLSSLGVTTNALYNPQVEARCGVGLNIGLVLDASTSIDNSERLIYANQMFAVVNQLATVGNINVQTVTFNNLGTHQASLSGPATSSLASSMWSFLAPSSLPAGGTVAPGAPGFPNGGSGTFAAATNWDSALQVAAGISGLDVVLLVTDGAPTRSRSTSAADSVRIFHVENAVLAANEIKAAGVPVVGVGVALPGGSEPNLMAVSGKVANRDYFTGGFDALAQLLIEYAQGLICQVPINVEKRIVNDQGQLVWQSGWPMTLAPGLLPDGASIAPAGLVQNTGTDGNPASWSIQFTETGQTATVTLTEATPLAINGMEYGFLSGVFEVLNSATGVTTTTPFDSATTPQITLGVRDRLTVKYVNEPLRGSLRIDKVIGGAGGVKPDTVFTGSYACTPAGPSGDWSITYDGDTTISNIPAGSNCTVTEDTSGLTQERLIDESFAWDSVGQVFPTSVSIESGETAKATVTNTTKRVYGSITITKDLVGTPDGFEGEFGGGWSCVYGQDEPVIGSWTVNPSGSATLDPASPQILLTSTCTVTETTIAPLPAGYTWQSHVVSPPATVDSAATPTAFTVTNTAVTIPPKLTLVKRVDNKGGLGTASAEAWELSATGTGGFGPLPTTSTDGGVTAATGAQTVQANTPYVLAESDVEGYDAGDWTCDSGIDVVNEAITLPLGANVTCEITNTVRTHQVTLQKRWIDAFQGDEVEIAIDEETNNSTANGEPDFTDTDNIVTVEAAVGAELLLAEVLDAENVGDYSTVLSCEPTASFVSDGETGRAYLLTVPDSDVTCTFTNTADTVKATLIKNWAAGSFAGDQAQLTIVQGATTLEQGTSTAPTSTTIEAAVRIGDVITMNEVLPGDNTGTYAETWVCNNGTNGTGPSTGNITVAGDVTCTFTNTPETVDVKLFKNWVNAFDGDQATLAILAIDVSFDISIAGADNPPDLPVVWVSNVRLGDQVTMSEMFDTENTGLYSTSWTCTNSSGGEGTTTPAITVTAPLSCTFINTAVAHTVKLQKQWFDAVQDDRATLMIVGANPETATSAATGATGSQIDTANVVTKTVRVGDTVDLSETLAADNAAQYTSTYECTPADGTPTGDGRSFQIASMPDTDVVCTFRNTSVRGTLTLEKIVVNDNGGDADPEDWELTADGPVTISGPDGSDAVTGVAVPAGDYALSEDDGPDGYEQTGLACFVIVDNDEVELLLVDDVVNVAGGTDVVCRFTNDDISPTLTLRKVVDNRDGVGVHEANEWTLTARAGDADPVIDEEGVLQDDDSAVTDTVDVDANTVYTLTEDGPIGYNASLWVCGDRVPATTIELGLDEHVTCTVTNTAKDATGKHDKELTSLTQQADGTWLIVYDVTVTNTSEASTYVYDLVDELLFPAEIVVQSATWSQGATVDQPFENEDPWSAKLATDRALPQTPGGVPPGDPAQHVYVITVEATIPSFPGSNDTWQDCAQDKSPGGFLNRAGLTVGDSETVYKDDCEPPVFPEPTKTGQTSSQNATTGVWTVSWLIEVENPSDIPLAAVVNDILPAAPANWTLVGGQWSITSDNPAVNLSLAPSASPQLIWQTSEGNLLPANATYQFVVTGQLQPSALAAPITCDPATGEGGLINEVELSVGEATQDDSDCVSTDTTTASVDKSVLETKQLVDGTWQITYLVEVENSDPELVAFYTLTDEPLLNGTDIVALEGRWAVSDANGVPTGEWTDLNLPGETTLVEDVPLVSGGIHYYVVEVTADVTVEGWENSELLECAEENTSEAGGFLNKATVTSGGGEPASDDACSEPALPETDKTGAVASQNDEDPDLWHVGYVVTVFPSGFDTFYTLKDIPGFPVGVELSATGTAQQVDSEHEPIGPEISISPGGVFPYDGEDNPAPVALGATETHYWVVTWDATIPGVIPEEAAKCGDEIAEGKGFYNLIELLQGERVVDDSDACIDIEDRVYPQVGKNVDSVTQNVVNGVWTIMYEVTATLAEAGSDLNPSGLSAKYDLEDVLDFGGDIEVLTATWSNGSPNGEFEEVGGVWSAELANDRVIAAGVTHTYLVRVTADVTAAAIEEDTLTCDLGAEPGAGGFLNRATLTAPGYEDDAHACAEPLLPDLEKVGGTTTDNGDGTWDIEYFLTVTYPESDQVPLPGTVGYDLTDELELPEGVSLIGSWTAEADGGDWPVTGETWDGEGTWTIVEAGVLTPEDDVHVFRIYATVEVTEVSEGALEECEDTVDTGILILNLGTVTSGHYVTSDDGCQVVHYDDVGIEKTSELPEGQTSVEPGDTFDWVLTVTNHGTRDTEEVVVTDELEERLAVVDVVLPDGWTDHSVGNALEFRTDSLAVGAVVDIVITVEFLPAVVPPQVDLVGDAEVPTPATPLEELVNEACVAAERDGDPTNNCDEADVPVRDITAVVYTRCINDAPLLGWEIVKSSLLTDEPIEFLWTPDYGTADTVPAEIAITHPGGTSTWSDLIDWPGVMFSPSGVSVDWPGWRALEAADYAPGGGFYFPGTTDVMDADQEAMFVFNGMIADPNVADAAWRFGPDYVDATTTVLFTVNPSLETTVGYPVATPECFVPRHTEVEIEKTASVQRTEPGKSFTYTIAVENVSDDSAADGVVVTDAIPADIRITSVTWPGKDDADVFPNWTTCAVAGQNAAGYGGTLTCELFGPLHPAASGNGPSAAPTITLGATVHPDTKASVITNVAVVDYHTFGNPDDAGRDSDDAVVLISGLPVTGGGPLLPLIMLGFLALAVGAATIVIRRRNGQAMAQL